MSCCNKNVTTKVFFQVCVIQARNSDAPVQSSCLDYAEIEAQTRVRLGIAAKETPNPGLALEEQDDSWLDEER